jgi:DNA polymerase-1
MLLILDGNNLAWAGYYALERAMKPETPERRLRVAVLGLASMALGTIARGGVAPGAPPDDTVAEVAVCFDEGRPIRRRAIFPAYQTGRERDPKFVANEPTVLAAIDEFRDAVRWLPVAVLRAPDTEADDLIAGLVRRGRGGPARIVSTDRDFLQLVGPATSIYSPVRKIVIDDAGFFAAMFPRASPEAPPFPRERFLDCRALVGDASDDVPGVPGVGEQSAVRLLAAAPLDAYFGDADRVRAALGRKSAVVEGAFASGAARAIVERNRALMDLRRPAPCWDDLDALTRRGAWDADRFRGWIEEQNIRTVDAAALFARMETLAEQDRP